MSLAALGCNPEHKWTVTGTGANQKFAGSNPTSAAEPGTLAYSPDGGLYMCVRAKGAVVQYAACVLEDAWEAVEITNTSDNGAIVVVPQVALADDEYGWGLIHGSGQVLVLANALANATLGASATANHLDDQGGDVIAGIYLTAGRGGSNGPAPCNVSFPKKILA